MFDLNKGNNNEDLLMLNRALIIQYLKRNGVCSRAEIANKTGLTQASITKITSALIEYNIIRETGIIAGEKGRRSIGIALNTDTCKVIGVKLSRKYFSVVLFDIGGKQYDIYSEAIESEYGTKHTVNRMKFAINALLKRCPEIVAIGIAVPGPFLHNKGKIALITQVPGWENISLNDEFTDAFDKPVFFEHDANAGALAEWWFGIHNKHQGVMVFVLVGEGIGAGIIVDGHVLKGNNGIAGEVGHMSIDANGSRCACGNYGCLEMYCSSLAVIKEAENELSAYPCSMLNSYSKITIDDIFSSANAGDAYALKLVLEAARYIAYGLVNVVNAYDPNVIIIGDLMSHGGEILLNEVKLVLKERLLKSIYENLTIDLSSFEEPILYGAAAIATDQYLKNPSKFIIKTSV